MNKYLKKYFIYLAIITVVIVLFVLPLLLLFSLSITDEKTLLENGYRLIPSVFSFSAYEMLLNNFQKYFSLITFTFAQSSISAMTSLLVMSLGAYVLSRDKYKFTKAANMIAFGAYFLKWGFVATYYINTRVLNLYDTFFIYILPNLVDIYFLLILKSFYAKIGRTLLRSAQMDGAGELKMFFKIALPMSLPLIFAVGILLFIYRWNDWFTSMLYVNDSSLYTLQYYLQRINREEEFIRSMMKITAGSGLSRSVPIYTTRFAMGVVSTIPLLFLAPLFKKSTAYCNFSME